MVYSKYIKLAAVEQEHRSVCDRASSRDDELNSFQEPIIGGSDIAKSIH
jgi:hypothetical protein